MLKAQLHSKLFKLQDLIKREGLIQTSLGGDSGRGGWQDIEDVLTGDFFGVLDYLPRQPYLRHFLERVEVLNDKRGRFELDRVDWEKVEMLFWPRCPGHDDATEPDVVLVSDRWIIVVEVKLESPLGKSQPWRE